MTSVAKQTIKSWSSTLRLPKSSFPARASPTELSTYLHRCSDDLYVWQRTARAASQPFVLHDGPPYANGELHVGHALNKILKDIINRTKLAQGYRVDYIPGWDCHGLPIELKALEKTGWKQEEKNDGWTVREAARAFASSTVKKQMKGFKSWGVMGDWQSHWKTMDKEFELRQLSVFKTLFRNRLIYRKHKPVYWSPSSQTALAEAELEYNETHESLTAMIKFPIAGAISRRYPGVQAAIWTTTPWTLPANQALAIHRDIRYCVAKTETGDLLILARSRIPFVEETIGQKLEVVEEVVSSEDLLASTYRLPQLFDPKQKTLRIRHADFVTESSGTGIVHCAPAHGMEDYEALQDMITNDKISVSAPVDDSGNFTEEASPGQPELLQGLHAFTDGNEQVLAAFAKLGLLLGTSQYLHKYPYDWRTKQPVMVRATEQWFADLSGIKSKALQALQDVSYHPENGLARLSSFIDHRNEWCISRQRAWGVPIPALINPNTGKPQLTGDTIAHIMKVIKERGIDAWWSDPPDESAWLPPGVPPGYRRGTDTMDVWFDSGTSWTGMNKRGDTTLSQADVYVEGTDQHRGWFQSSLLTYVAVQMSEHRQAQPKAPFKQLLTHGFTLDADGRKMSKSIGNVISPEAIISGLDQSDDASPKASSKMNTKQHGSLGPDALRLWVASSDWTRDVVISKTVVENVHSALRKLRVTFKVLLGVLRDFEAEGVVPLIDLALSDRIAILHLWKTSQAVQNAYQQLEYHQVVSQINKFVNASFSGFYLESVKDTLYCDSPSHIRRQGALTVLYHIFHQLQNMLAPLTPLLVEESWEHTPEQIRKIDGHPLQRTWEAFDVPEDLVSRTEQQASLFMTINDAVKQVQEQARNDKNMKTSLESDVSIRLSTSTKMDKFDLNTTELQEALVVSALRTLSGTDAINHDHRGVGEDPSSWSYQQPFDVPGEDVKGTVEISKPQGSKCSRCWKYTVEVVMPTPADTGSNEEHEQLCARCSSVVGEMQA